MKVVIALLLFSAGAANAADAVADELKKLQGEWQAVEVEAQGRKNGKDHPDVRILRFRFDDKGMMQPVTDGGGQGRKKSIKLDPTKSPKEIDITSHDGQEKDKTAACIYKLDGDRLTICIPYFAKDTSVRPKEFKADDGIMVITLERAKAK